MNKVDVLRALKDPAYRESLSDEEKAQLPAIANFGLVADTELENIVGGSVVDRVLWTVTDTSCKSHCRCTLEQTTLISSQQAVVLCT